MKIKPRNKRVLVEEIKADDKIGGVYLPSTTEKDKKAQGIIKEISSDITDLKVGQTIIFGVYAGEEVKIGNDKKDYRILDDADILAVIE